MAKHQPDTGSLADLLRDVLRQPSDDRLKPTDTAVTRALRDVFHDMRAANAAAGRKAQGRTAGKAASKGTSRAVSRLKLAKSLAEVRTNILAATGRMTPMEKLWTTQLANELAARLRKL